MDPRFRRANSSGMAAETSLTAARLAAVLELIERDAFVRAWQGSTAPGHWRQESWPGWFAKEVEGLSIVTPDVRVLVLNSVLPTVIVAILSDGWPALSLGASAGADPEVCLEKAWFEASAAYVTQSAHPSDVARSIDEIRTPLDHASFYCEAENLRWIRSFFEGRERLAPSGVDDVWSLVRSLDPVFVNLPSITVNLKVVRAFSQTLEPISFGEDSVAIHSQAASKDAPWRPDQNPHPFP
jgi:YcaO cyclodehydratase, ATP-ad Mg2+-binding